MKYLKTFNEGLEKSDNIMKVVHVDSDNIYLDNGRKLFKLTHYHESDCCEHHYLDLTHLGLDDFEDLEFDLSGDDFFERISGYGIALKPIHGHPVRIPGYGSNNGYYIHNLSLQLIDMETDDTIKSWDISDCQVVTD